LVNRVLRIDALTLPDHSYLDSSDICYYAGEYTAGENHAFSQTNQLIFNFKKSIDKKGTPQWQYKEKAIIQSALILKSAINPQSHITLVPVPPSKAIGDPMYDDRVQRMAHAMCSGTNLEVKELVSQQVSTEPSHLSESRPAPHNLISNYVVNESCADPAPSTIVILDDVITTGCHFKAMKAVLSRRFPDASIYGLFIARRVPKAVDFDFSDCL
jgi:hypothetical protein